MAKLEPTRMTYLGGHSGRKGLIGVLAFPEGFPPETELTVFYMMLDGQWSQRQFPFDVSSVTYLADPKGERRSWWLLGKRGEVVELPAGEPRTERIDGAGTGRGKLGYLSCIRVIDGELFACGYRRQVHRRERRGWKLVSRAILDDRKKGPWRGFEAVDGYAADDLYAVGDDGEIWHFDGKSWRSCASPTDRHLADVRCLDDGVWICGDGGVVLRGDKRGWKVVWSDPEPAEEWWAIERFRGDVYVAGASFLGVLRKGRIAAVDTGVKGSLTAGTLHEKDGLLWSIGAKHVLSFDGKKWKEHVCPENR